MSSTSNNAPGMLSYLLPSLTITQTVALVVCVIIIIRILTGKKYRLPPGPRPLPLIGNYLDLRGKNMFLPIQEWSQKYGPMYIFYMGPERVLVISDIDILTEAYYLPDHSFAHKPKQFVLDYFSAGGQDIAFSNYSEAQRFRRKMTMQALREYLTGDQLSKRVNESLKSSIEAMLAEKQAFDPDVHLTKIIVNLMHGICFGTVFEGDDLKYKSFHEIFNNLEGMFGVFLEDVFPPLQYCPTRHCRRVMRHIDAFIKYTQEYWNELESNFDPANVSNLTENIILALRKRESSYGKQSDFTESSAVRVLVDVFFAGISTSRHTLRWILLILAFHTDTQEKMYREIVDAVGDAVPGRQHRAKLVYTEAVVLEALRIYPVAPFGLPHRTAHDTKLAGYDIPAQTQVLANQYAIQRDPKHWEDPDSFKPERFLDKTGTALAPKIPSWIPFSVGPRNCLGEFLAKQELVLSVTGILQKVQVSLPEGEIADFSPSEQSFSYHAKPYKVLTKRRTTDERQ